MLWTILCAGPSLWELEAEDLGSPGSVVAVNHAATHTLPYQYLCALDSPKDFQSGALSKVPEDTVIWCNRSKSSVWSRHGVVDAHPDHEHAFREEYVPNPMRYSYNVGSVFVALARAIASGARTLRVYGCDMESPEGESRWKRERFRMIEALGRWSEDGVSFDFRGRWSPPMILSACA